ncbi:hypothetical protein FB451DRAFT_1410963 [Mycena latifolia]|nr:hypothetical protein FB451DRAFT_1410963 [Mycena latifolia]
MSPHNPLAATASTSSALPMPTSSTSPYFDSRPPLIIIPDWVGYFGIVLFAGIVICQFHSALMTKDPPYKELTRTESTGNGSAAKPMSSPSETLGNEQNSRPAVPNAEEALFRFTAINTMKNKRAQRSETPLPPMVRPPGARW